VLRDFGHDVVSVDRQMPADPAPGVVYRRVDMGDLGQVISMMRGSEALVHLAAIPDPSLDADEVVYLNNVGATYNALQAAMVVGIDRAIVASSVSAYGMAWARPTFPPLFVPLDESHPFITKDPYGLSKEADERTAEMFVRRCGMTVLAYRLNWIGQPGEAGRRARDPKNTPDKDCTNLWGYIDVRDAARAIHLGLVADVSGFMPLNITANDTLRSEPTEELLRKYLPTTEIREPLPDFTSPWDNRKAREVLGFIPQFSWRDDDGDLAITD
jgi:nucleoside-diphosphate-sugar epimerase